MRQQAITWNSVDQDLRHHMASLGHNESRHTNIKSSKTSIFRLKQYKPSLVYREQHCLNKAQNEGRLGLAKSDS